MTITQNVASKLVVGFVAVSMLFTLSFAPAKAATSEELQAQITALLAQIAALQGQVGQAPSTNTCAEFTMDLTMGAKGADVTGLQNFLINHGYAIAAGATGYFGGQTQAALSAFQSAKAISPAAGYFGPITRAAVNAMCVAQDDDANDDDANDDDANDDANDDSDELSGEASLDDVTVNDGDDTSLEEGQEDAPVAEAEFEFADGDAEITRIDVSLVNTDDGNDEVDPWDVFDEVSLWVDGDEVARMDASDEDEYLDEDDGSLRFSGLDIVAMEDEAVTVVLAVSVQSSVDGTSDGADWDAQFEAVRFLDADDVSTTETTVGDLNTDVSFDINEEGNDDEIIVKTSAEDPDATTLAVEDDEKSDWYTIFAYDLDTDDSVNDIEVNELEVNLYSANDVINSLVSDMQLVIDGETYDDYTMTDGTAATGTAVFDIDGDLVIDAGERVTVEVQVEFKAMTGNYDEGDSISASTTGATGDFEGADDVTGEGSATGDTHTLRTSGAVIELSEVSEEIKANAEVVTDDEGVFTIEFEVTAFETDLYIDDGTPTQGTTGTSTGANFIITSGGTATSTAGDTVVATLDSSASLDGGRYLVAEGETETFTLTVEFDPAGNGAFKVQLYSVNYNDANAVAETQQLTTPAEDFDTDSLSI